jgi:DNA repair exonuclease SbcCD ATPase subunit
MRLIEISLDGFGRLVNHRFQFSSGFNLVCGPNEAGKSTLQRAILSLLYGFFGAGRIKAARRDAVTAFQPWDEGASYAGWMIYSLDGGQSFLVSRTFAPSDTLLTTYPDKIDISSQFEKASQGRLFFADEQLGMSREVFENTCYVRQAELVALDASASAITETLTRLSAAASAKIAATDAVALLQKTLKEEVGTARSPTKPLARAKKHLVKLEEEWDQVMQARRGLFSQIVELNQSKDKLQELESQRQQLRYLQALAESRAILQQLLAAEEADAEVSRCGEEVSKWKAWASFPVRLNEDVHQLSTQRIHLRKECSKSQQRAAQAQEGLQPIKTQITALEKRVGELEDARDVSAQELSQVRKLAGRWKMADESGHLAYERWHKASSTLEEVEQKAGEERARLGPAINLGHAGLAELKQRLVTARQRETKAAENLENAQADWVRVGMDEAKFQELERTAQEIQSGIRPVPKPRKGCKALLSRQPAQAADQTPTELVIYAQLRPIYEPWVQARAEDEAAKKALSELEAGVIDQLGGLIDDTLNEDAFARLGRRLERHLRAEAGIRQQTATVASLKEELDTAQQSYETAREALQTALAGLGFDTVNVQTALDDYVKGCERNEQLGRAEAEFERLQLRAQALERDVHDWQEKQAAVVRVETELCGLLAQAGIECTADSLETALDRFTRGVGDYNRWAKAKAAYDAAIKHQSSFPDAEARARLEASSAEIEAKLGTMQTEHPEWSELEPDRTPQEYVTRGQQTDDAWASAREECNRLRDAIQRSTSNLRHPAEIDEEIGQARAEIQRLERFGAALTLASEELNETTEKFQKQFAPKLERLMSEGLSRVTGGRYSDVQVESKSLNVSLMAPELDRFVGVERLSKGTRDLVYLMLRIAIARLMSRSEEKLPLLLDDPLVQCDRDRQDQTLQFLAHLAQETQVFLFTKDEWTREWFEKELGASSAHNVLVLD